MKDSYQIQKEKVTRTVEYNQTLRTDQGETESFIGALSKTIPFDTGFLPPGLRSYTQVGNYSQMVFVLPPTISRINWGVREGDRYAKQYMLAQPWRIIITDMIDGDMHGTRMFYSPTPINSPEQILYHQNLPNINCLSYQGNGVGWVCLYKTNSWQDLSLAEKALQILERCSGSETYNDRNMSGIDGPALYQKMNKPEYTWDKLEWEKKTAKEGIMWTFDDSLWIPVTVVSERNQDAHRDNGVPLTLQMAMNGHYAAYYGDPVDQKSTGKLRTGGDVKEEIWTALRGAFAQS